MLIGAFGLVAASNITHQIPRTRDQLIWAVTGIVALVAGSYIRKRAGKSKR